MAGNADLQRKLNQGIEAAKAGDRATARRLLEEVVEQDDRSEMAWIWLATVATGAAQRREYLRKVLAINPRNQRAREALASLGEEAPAPARSRFTSATPTLEETVRRTDALATQRRGGSGLIFVIAAVALLLAGMGIILFGSGVLNPPAPTATPPVISQQDGEPTVEGVVPPTPAETPLPSNTPVPIELVTRSAPTLPATQTATLTPTTTPTPVVTAVLELSEFEIFYVSQDLSLAEPSLYSIRADGTGETLIAERMRDISFAQDGVTFAFVRDVVGSSGSRVPEVFVSTLTDPSSVTQVTSLGAPDTGSPSMAPDGTRIVFSSSNGLSTPDLWIVEVTGGAPVQLTNTEEGEREPAWSPAGDLIAYTSDQGNVGSTEIYILSVTPRGEPLGSPVQATSAGRNSYAPQWSADGRFIVFASDRTGDGDVFTMDAQGNNEQLVTIDDGGAEDRRPSFSPDGRWIAFVSNREDGNFQTFVILSNGTTVRRVTVSARADVSTLFRSRRIE